MMNQFKQWMKQAGIIKQLQLALAVCLIVIALLIQQLISSNASQVTVKNTTSQVKQEKEEVTEAELQDLVENYLANFFGTSEAALDYLKTHTETDLFLHNIEPEIQKRIAIKLSSQLALSDLYIESINSNQAKAICLAQENFPNGDYQSRQFNIELIIDTSSMKIVAIPVLQITN